MDLINYTYTNNTTLYVKCFTVCIYISYVYFGKIHIILIVVLFFDYITQYKTIQERY